MDATVGNGGSWGRVDIVRSKGCLVPEDIDCRKPHSVTIIKSSFNSWKPVVVQALKKSFVLPDMIYDMISICLVSLPRSNISFAWVWLGLIVVELFLCNSVNSNMIWAMQTRIRYLSCANTVYVYRQFWLLLLPTLCWVGRTSISSWLHLSVPTILDV